MKKKICFIINPIAGLGIQKIDKQQVETYFDTDTFELSFKETEYGGHAGILAQEALAEKACIIVACGGDGTINEIASELVGTNVALGFIPIGSGNGLASNLNIPKKINEALEKLASNQTKTIDVGLVNNTYFFSNMGIGFDSEVLQRYKRIKNRPFLSYFKAVTATFFKYRNPANLQLVMDNIPLSVNPFMLFVANSNQLGYNISLAREASLTDGLLNLVIIKKQPKHKLIFLGLLMLLKQEKRFKGIIHYQIKNIRVKPEDSDAFIFQKDGELLQVEEKELSISILNNALKVIC